MGNIVLTSGFAVPGYVVSGSVTPTLATTSPNNSTVLFSNSGLMIERVLFGRYFVSEGFMEPNDIGNIQFDNSANGGPNISAGLNYQADQYVPLQQTGYVDYGIYDDGGSGLQVPYKIVSVIDDQNIQLDGVLTTGGVIRFVTTKGFGAKKITITGLEFRLASVGGTSVLIGPYVTPITITIGNGVDMMEPIVVQWTSSNVYITYE